MCAVAGKCPIDLSNLDLGVSFIGLREYFETLVLLLVSLAVIVETIDKIWIIPALFSLKLLLVNSPLLY